MQPIEIKVAGENGMLFEATIGDAIAFVPANFIRETVPGTFTYDEVAYVTSRWADKNARFSDAKIGMRKIFPDVARPVTTSRDSRVAALLTRFRNVYKVSVGE